MTQHYKYLEQYHSALALVDGRYAELQSARAELLWYEGKLAEADGLAVQHGLSKAANILQGMGLDASSSKQSLVNVQLDRDNLLDVFSTLQEVLKQLQSSQGSFQHQLSNIQNRYESDLQVLRERQTNLEKQFKEISRLLDAAKMSIFFHLFVIAIVTGLAAYLAKDLKSTAIAATVALVIALIVPIFYGRGLASAILYVKEQSKTYQDFNRQVKEMRRRIPQDEEDLRIRKRDQEIQLRANLENLRQQAKDTLLSIQAFVSSARYDAEEVKPKLLQNEWNRQKVDIDRIVERVGRPVFDWQEKEWKADYTCPKPDNISINSLFRIGDLLIEREQDNAIVPAILALHAPKPNAKQHFSGHVVVFSNDGDSRQAVLQTIESLAVRTMASLPALTCKGIFIDPVNTGNTFPFSNFPDNIVGKETYTRSEDIREQLRLLVEHVTDITQRSLTRQYEMIDEYNEANIKIAEAYRYVFVADFPSSFERAAIEDLKSLLLNGARAGVYVVLHVDDSLEKPRDFRYDIFDEWCTVLRPAYGLTTGGSYCQSGRFKGSFKVGYVYLGRVSRILHSGAFVEFLPGKEGMLPTAQMTEKRIRYPEEAVNVGQILAVRINSIDGQDRATLTCLGIQGHEALSAACLALQTEDFQHEGVPLFTLQLPNGEAFRIRLDNPPAREQFKQIADKVSESTKAAAKDKGKVDFLLPKELWIKDSSSNLSVPIGLAGAGKDLTFLLGMYEDRSYEPAHALLAGATGSGKSGTIHAIILNLALHYSPDELELYLLDYKEGVEFQIYVTPPSNTNAPNSHNPLNDLSDPDPKRILPHAQVISIQSDVEFGLSVLAKAISEIQTRAELFKSSGSGISNLESYRKATGKKLPRLLIVIDEYQQMYLQADSRLCDRLNDALEEITKQGRSYGVHLLLGSQSPRVTDFRERIYEQMAVRMAMPMGRSTAEMLMAKGNVDLVERLDRTGKLAYNDRLGEGYTEVGQVVYVDSDAQIKAMDQILRTSSDRKYKRSSSTVVFNGIQPAQLKRNSELSAIVNCDRWLEPKDLNDQYLKEKDWISLEKPCASWLGESMRIGRQVRTIFRRRPRNHLLIIGTTENEIFGMLEAMLIGLVHTCSPTNIAFQIADFSLSEGETAEIMPSFRDHFEKIFDVSIGKRFANGDRQIVRAEVIWQQVIEEFDRRQAIRQADTDTMDFGKSLFFIFALGSLSQMDRFRPVAGRGGDDMSPDAKKLLEIASKGSELGIHIVLWLSDFKSFPQLFGGNRSALTHFDLRVAFKMGDRDSQDFLGEGIAKNLRDSQAYFTDASTPDTPEKFRPYAALSPAVVDTYAQSLKQRR